MPANQEYEEYAYLNPNKLLNVLIFVSVAHSYSGIYTTSMYSLACLGRS